MDLSFSISVLSASRGPQPPGAWGLLLGILIFALLGIYYGHLREKARSRELGGVARRHKLHFQAAQNTRFNLKYAMLQSMQQGHSQYACNLMHGEIDGYPVQAFDYQFVTGHGKHRQTHRFSAALFDMDARFPELIIRPEGVLDKLAAFVGYEDVDFESDEFSRKFHVKAKHRRFAYDVLHPRMMQLLLSRTNWMYEMDGRYLLIQSGRLRWSAGEFDEALRLGMEIIGLMPDFVRKKSGMAVEERA